MTITRAVIVDLWPIYSSGDASDDTRALVESFLRDDPSFADELKRDVPIPAAPPALPRDAEAEAVARLRGSRQGQPLFILLTLAVLFSCFAFGRIVADTSWDVSPRNFIATAVIAGGFWIAFCVGLWWMRARIPVRRSPPRV